jgi:hypothetical protein
MFTNTIDALLITEILAIGNSKCLDDDSTVNSAVTEPGSLYNFPGQNSEPFEVFS